MKPNDTKGSILVSAHELSKSFSAKTLFTGLNFTIKRGERVGLIGPNGAGKSTVLKILASEIEPDSGSLSAGKSLKIAYVEQVPKFSENATVGSTLCDELENLEDWEKYQKSQEIISRFGLDQANSANTETEADTLLVKNLSGGWQKRVSLAREIIKEPDLLLLDEPTNHLDIEGIIWLEALLRNSRFASLTITHDRLFLQRIATRILELDSRHKGGVISVDGDYSKFLEVREGLISAQERREVVLKNTMRRETEWLRRGPKARTTKQQARIQRAEGLNSEVDDLEKRNLQKKSTFQFQNSEKNPKKLIEAKKLGMAYGNQVIFSDLDLLITPGTRLGLIGQNGCGKTTLIRALLGKETPTEGTIKHAENLSVAYFDQIRDSLDPEETLLKSICPSGDRVDYRGSLIHVRSYLDRFLFTQEQMDLPVHKLSGGEQNRILLARLMLTKANLLVLDEPTNDLDIATLAVLEECLTDFSGAVILVTHDRYFLDQVANLLLAFPKVSHPKHLERLADLYQWEAWHNEEIKRARAQEKEGSSLLSSSGFKKNVVKAKKPGRLSFKEQREFDSMEKDIAGAEAMLAKLTDESDLSEVSADAGKLSEITQKMGNAQSEIDRLYQRWAELEKILKEGQ